MGGRVSLSLFLILCAFVIIYIGVQRTWLHEVLSTNIGWIYANHPDIRKYSKKENSSGSLPSEETQDTRNTSNAVTALALIFTTFSDQPKKHQAFSNTIKNWASFLPDIQPVLFSTNVTSSLDTLAEQYGWIVAPCPRLNTYRMPYLKDMYFEAYNIDTARFYGYANADILFDDGLLRSLKKIEQELPDFNATLISGLRRNLIPQDCSVVDDLWKQWDVKKSTIGSLPGPDHAQDYFFVTRDYPWAPVKDVVIGRVAYDNYLIGLSRQLQITTIDISKTITAIHQCNNLKTQRDFNITEMDLTFNKDAIGPFDWGSGLLSKMAWQTDLDMNDKVIIVKRP